MIRELAFRIYYIHLLIMQHSGAHIEFGAQQCQFARRCYDFLANYREGILVRDDAARDRLRAQVGDIGLILSAFNT